jgi:hypothetical protein
MSPAAPTRAIMTPATLNHLVFKLKNASPINKVNKGVSEFNIPASELSIPVWAVAKRKAGAPLPTTPTIVRYFQSRLLGSLNLLKAKGRRKMNEMTILRAPTSRFEK